MEERLTAIILAAGKGTRMKSPLPKVLHPVAGTPMISLVIQALKAAGTKEIRVVVGHGEHLIRSVVEPQEVTCHQQIAQQGTADAVRSADIPSLEGAVVILNGDHPLLLSNEIERLFKKFNDQEMDLGVVSVKLKSPGRYGRIVRHHGSLKAIVEASDASHETLKIKEVNTGIYFVKGELLKKYLPLIKNNNSKKEYYLTDLVGICLEHNKKVGILEGHPSCALGVNTQGELARATQLLFKRRVKVLLEEGVVIIDPAATYIEDRVRIGAATVIYPNVYIKSGSVIGSFCVLESNVFISGSTIGDSVQVRAGSYLEQAHIARKATVGPYARLRPGTQLKEEAHIGNFVECKNVVLGARTKAAHLTYLGDAEIGEDCNIGCGTITCNYQVDRKKYKTKIGNKVFVGSDTQFVAPVEVGEGAIIGSGSTITKNVPPNALAVSRAQQFIKENYAQRFQIKESGETELSGDSKKK